MTQVNARVHRVTRRAPAEMLDQERARLHPIPAAPHTVAFGVTRTVPANTPMVSFEGGQYSVPRTPARSDRCGSACHGAGRRRAGRHRARRRRPGRSRSPATPGPPRAARRSTTTTSRRAPAGALDRKPLARNAAEVEFLAIGDGARLWLTEAAAAGTHEDPGQDGPSRDAGEAVRDQATSTGRSGTPRSTPGSPRPTSPRSSTTTSTPRAHAAVSRAGEDGSLTQGTAGWAALGAAPTSGTSPTTDATDAVTSIDPRPEVTS